MEATLDRFLQSPSEGPIKEAGACECVRCQQECGSSGDVRYGGNARDDGDLRSEREGLQQKI